MLSPSVWTVSKSPSKRMATVNSLICVAIGPRTTAQQAYPRLAVVIPTETNAHVSAPAIGRISVRAQEQRDVVVIFRIPHLELDGHSRIKACNIARFEIRARIESEAVCALDQRIRAAFAERGHRYRSFRGRALSTGRWIPRFQ